MTGRAPQMAVDATELARRTGGSWSGGTPALTVSGIEIDSRACAAGSLFAALPGQHADGQDLSPPPPQTAPSRRLSRSLSPTPPAGF